MIIVSNSFSIMSSSAANVVGICAKLCASILFESVLNAYEIKSDMLKKKITAWQVLCKLHQSWPLATLIYA